MYGRDRPDFLKSAHEVNVESSDSEIIKTSGNDDETKLSLFRKRFRAAFEHSQRWQDEAHEDYEFVSGRQWKDEEVESLEKQGRPAITINRIRSLLNIVSGYQRVNRYDINFLGRTSDDVELAHVRTGVTKYVLDRCEYENIESQVFLDCAISGIGVFGVKYKYDYEVDDGEANVERVDPFSIYVDPEAHELDYSDAKFVVRCQWCDKDELKQIYTEKAEDIEGAFALYDSIEQDGKTDKEIDPFWYSSELQKIRVCEYWYKVKDKKIMLQLSSGDTIAYDEETKQQIDFLVQTGQVAVVAQQEIPVTNVRVCTFFDNILLEDIKNN